MAKLVLFGCGRGADVAARCLAEDSPHQVCAFTVDAPFRKQDSFRGLPLVDFADVETRYPPDEFSMFVLLGYQGMNDLRMEKYREAKRKGYTCISYVSSNIARRDTLRVGENCFILENQSINYDVRIGHNVVIWSGCQIGDESVIGNHAWLSSHAVLSGQVSIGEFAFLGVNCTISNSVRIARKSYIGGSAFITRDTAENGVYVVECTKPFGVHSDTFLKLLDQGRKDGV